LSGLIIDGSASNIAPYATEMFPVRLAARGTGLAQAANGVGKILGPLSLALIAGADNYVAPQATAAAILPGFLFLAACGAAVGVACSVTAIETHGRPLALTHTDSAAAPAARRAGERLA
jgi:putative MFS transporter